MDSKHTVPLKEVSSEEALIWSPKRVRQLRAHVNEDTLKCFIRHWQRILEGMGFFMIPYNADSIERMKSAHVWHVLVNDLLRQYSIEDIAQQSGLSVVIVKDVVAEDGDETFNMPIEAGVKLLQLHKLLETETLEN